MHGPTLKRHRLNHNRASGSQLVMKTKLHMVLTYKHTVLGYKYTVLGNKRTIQSIIMLCIATLLFPRNLTDYI